MSGIGLLFGSIDGVRPGTKDKIRLEVYSDKIVFKGFMEKSVNIDNIEKVLISSKIHKQKTMFNLYQYDILSLEYPGEYDLPPIVCKKDEIDQMRQNINTFLEMKNADIDILNALKNDSYYLYQIMLTLSKGCGYLQHAISIRPGVQLFTKYFKMIYTKIKNTKSSDESVAAIFSRDSYYKMLSEFIYNDVIDEDVLNEYQSEKNRIIETISETILENASSVMDEDIFNFIVGEYTGKLPDVVDGYFKDEEVPNIIKYAFAFVFILKYVYIFSKMLIIYKYSSEFENSEELFTMYRNVADGVKEDVKYVVEKIYPIYNKLYREKLGYEYSKIDFTVLVIVEAGKKIVFDKLGIITTEDSRGLRKCNSREEFESIISNMLQRVDVVENLAKNGIKYGVNSKSEILDNINVLLVSYVGDIINDGLIEKYSHFEYLIDMEESLSSKILDILETDHVEHEKNRLLSGNIEKEKRYIIDKYDYHNIKNGYEFEEYLANLFSQIGYAVELTKKSGDQGGDLLLRKNGKTIIAQAKYYSSPVGNQAVQEVVAAITYYSADLGIVITNNTFTKAAVELAQSNNIELIDGNGIDQIKSKIIAL